MSNTYSPHQITCIDVHHILSSPDKSPLHRSHVIFMWLSRSAHRKCILSVVSHTQSFTFFRLYLTLNHCISHSIILVDILEIWTEGSPDQDSNSCIHNLPTVFTPDHLSLLTHQTLYHLPNHFSTVSVTLDDVVTTNSRDPGRRTVQEIGIPSERVNPGLLRRDSVLSHKHQSRLKCHLVYCLVSCHW
jgi:hypothetical protein